LPARDPQEASIRERVLGILGDNAIALIQFGSRLLKPRDNDLCRQPFPFTSGHVCMSNLSKRSAGRPTGRGYLLSAPNSGRISADARCAASCIQDFRYGFPNRLASGLWLAVAGVLWIHFGR
jgi:hypothetical protein